MPSSGKRLGQMLELSHKSCSFGHLISCMRISPSKSISGRRTFAGDQSAAPPQGSKFVCSITSGRTSLHKHATRTTGELGHLGTADISLQLITQLASFGTGYKCMVSYSVQIRATCDIPIHIPQVLDLARAKYITLDTDIHNMAAYGAAKTGHELTMAR